MGRDAPICKVKIDSARSACIRGVDQRLAGAVRDPNETSLKRSFGMCQFGQPPQGGQLLMPSRNPFNEQPGLKSRSDSGKVSASMSGTLQQCTGQPVRRIVDPLGERREQVRCLRPSAHDLLQSLGGTRRGPRYAGRLPML
jgi:hypothetical protein